MLKIKLISLFFIVFTINSMAQTAEKPTPQWRPSYHFSPLKNWTNDPNGLIFLNGEFNLYYQHNPFENKWGHMSWGHATSKDLVNWKHLPVAIPEIISHDTITMIYSGSAVLDKNNTSGFGSPSMPPIVAIFTADQPNQKKESQFIAYSNDQGMTFKQYANNPVIDLNKRDFRDPNVFWNEPSKQWIMTVAVPAEHNIRIYGSKNLRDWKVLSIFGPSGLAKDQWECPFMVPLAVDGNSKNIKWVLMISSGGPRGPFMQYFVGDFNGETFKNDNANDNIFTVDYGDAFYAAIPWRDAPNNKKILLGWIQAGRQETYPWKCQMSIPRDLSLKTTSDGIRLFQNPSSVISNSLSKFSKGHLVSEKNISINEKSIDLSKDGRITGNSYWINAEFKINDSKKSGFNLTEKKDGNGLASRKVIVGYDAVKQELFVDCTSSEKGNKSSNNLIQTAPMKPVNGIVKFQILLDNASLEVFGNDGEKVITTMIYPDADATGISAFSEGNATISQLKIWDLHHIK